MTYITIREHRYSKLEIPTQYFQEHFASFPKIIFQSFESALNFALNAHFFCDFHTPCFRPVLCRFFFLFLQLHLHSVDFPRKKSAVGFSNRLCFTQKRNHLRNKKIYVATKCKATSKVPKQFLYFFYDPEKTFTVVYLFWCRFKWNVSVIITLQFRFIRLDWRSMT